MNAQEILESASGSKDAPGVYAVVCTASGHLYIGKAGFISSRWNRHRADLRARKDCAPPLQDEWNKYGEEAFEFVVLENCRLDKLNERELFWIDSTDSTILLNTAHCFERHPRRGKKPEKKILELVPTSEEKPQSPNPLKEYNRRLKK